MDTLWLESKLSPDTRINVPTEPLEGEMDAEAGGLGVGVLVGGTGVLVWGVPPS